VLEVTATVALLYHEKLAEPADRLRSIPLYKSPDLGFAEVKCLMGKWLR